MDTFIKLNRDKLKSIFIRTALLCLGFVFIVLTVGYYFTGNFLTTQLLFGIMLAAGIGLPVFVLLLGYLLWTLNQKARQKTFSKSPFNEIESIGFYKAFIDHSSKWELTKEIKEGKLNDFTLRMDLSKDKGWHTIEFETPTEWKKLEKSEYKHLTEKFGHYGIEFRIGSLVKYYDTKQQTLQTVSDLRKDLELFTTLLRQEGFEPQT